MLNDVCHPKAEPDFIPKNHISYEAESAIRKMIKPLNKLGGIEYFCYGVNYPDTSGFTLHTNSAFYESWFEGGRPLFGFFLKGWHIYDHLLPQNVLAVAQSQGLGNFVTYIEHHQDKTIIFEFGSKPDNANSIAFYKDNIGLLRKFGDYFANSLGKDLIETAEQQRIMPPEKMLKCKNLPASSLLTRPNAVPMAGLTEQEKCYLRYLLRGYANNDIASSVKASPKLVSKKLSLIKKKLQCKSKSQLFHRANTDGTLHYQFDHHWLNLIKENQFDDDEVELFLKQLYQPVWKLSQQELLCYQLLLQGYTLAEMSKKLVIGIPTVADYITRLKLKLKCVNKLELFDQAIKDGYISYQL